MTILLYDADPRQEIQSKEWSASSPRHYIYCLRKAAEALGIEMVRHHPTLRGDGIYFTWRPSLRKIIEVPRCRLVFLAFGIPTQADRFKFRFAWIRFLLICTLATEVVTMDQRTYQVLRRYRFLRHKITRMEAIVDVAYFSTLRAPEDFLLIVGDSDRDERVVRELAESFDIVRVTTAKRVSDTGVLVHPRIKLLFQIDYDVLRTLYARCAVVVMPINTKRHAAGTTTVTEALSAGAPVISNSLSHWYSFRKFPNFFYRWNINQGSVADVLARTDQSTADELDSHLALIDLSSGTAYFEALFTRVLRLAGR